MKYPYPIKNWLNESEYPKPKSLSMDQWAWEFTRRNGEYQKHWDIFNSLPDASLVVGNKNGKLKGTPWLDQRMGEYFGYVDPPSLPDETYEDYMKRQGDNDYTIEPYLNFFTRTFGARPFNPRDDNPPDFLYDLLSEHPPVIDLPMVVSIPPPQSHKIEHDIFIGQFKEISTGADIKHPVCLVFDLSRDIGPQIEEAKSILTDRLEILVSCNPEFKKRRARVPTSELASYLRLLDARAVAVEWDEIAEVLSPGADNRYPNKSAEKKHRAQFATAEAYGYHFPRK